MHTDKAEPTIATLVDSSWLSQIDPIELTQSNRLIIIAHFKSLHKAATWTNRTAIAGALWNANASGICSDSDSVRVSDRVGLSCGEQRWWRIRFYDHNHRLLIRCNDRLRLSLQGTPISLRNLPLSTLREAALSCLLIAARDAYKVLPAKQYGRTISRMIA